MIAGESNKAPAWWRCDTHGPAKAGAWGCPECVREMRAELKRLRAAHGTAVEALKAERKHSRAARRLLVKALDAIPDYSDGRNDRTVSAVENWLDDFDGKQRRGDGGA